MLNFRDLLFADMDLEGNDEISVIVDGGLPDRMYVKSARVIYKDFLVCWFCGRIYCITSAKENAF